MSFRSWLESVRGRCGVRAKSRRLKGAKQHRATAAQTTEALEPRCLLTVSGFVLNGTDMSIVMNSNDSIQVQADASGFVQVLSGTTTVAVSHVLASSLTSISIQGSDSANSIDLSAITSSNFSSNLVINVHGGDGADTLIGSTLADNFFGDNGADSIVGGAGADTLSGGDGNDTITGGTENDSILGGDGADSITGDDGDDTLNGGNGADSLSGGLGNDSILAGSGQDTANGDAGDDTVNGEDGNDSLLGSDGNDAIYGGNGNDTVSAGNGLDTINGNAGDDLLGGDAGNDSITGDDGNDSITGGDGDDVINGGLGNDTVLGQSGNDSILGDAGNDALFGDENDPFKLGTGNDTVLGQGGNDTLNGGGGADSLDGGIGNDLIQSGDLDSATAVIATIANATNVIEGSTGQTTNAVFVVSLNRASTKTVTVDYTTADGSATGSAPNADYTPVSGTLQFAPGVTTVQILVPVIGDGQLEADENFFVRLSNPTNVIIGDTEGETFILNDDGWSAAGPGPVNNAQVQGISPNNEISGAIEALAVHPTNANIMYVGGVQGGIWRTNNATAASPTWTPLTDFLPSLSVGSIEFDPTDATGNTLVASFARSSSFGAVGGPSTGMARTTDGGATWTLIGPAILQGQTLLNSAARGNVLMAASDNVWAGGGGSGLFRSTDGGTTFVQVSGGAGTGLPSGAVSSLVGDSANSSRFYAAVRQQGVFRSDDGGATWINTSTGLTGVAASIRILLAVHSTTTTNAVYAVVIDNQGQIGGLFRSANAGANWSALDTPTVLGGQGAVHGAVAADPTNSNIVYVSGDAGGNTLLDAARIDASLSAGSQITSIVGANADPDGNGPLSGTTPHADSRRLKFAADGTLINTSDGGVYRRSNPQQSTGVWTSLNSNLQILEEHDMAYDPVSNIIFAGAQDNGTEQQSATGSTTWNFTFGGDGGDVVVDPLAIANQSIRYASAQDLGGLHGDIYTAANTFVSRFSPALTVTGNGAAFVARFVTPLATNTQVGNRLLIAGGNSLYESLNRGTAITEVGAGIVANSGNAMVYGGRVGAATNPELIYVGAGNRLQRRVAAGNNFANVASYPGSFVQAVVLDSNNSNNIYVADSQNRVWQSTNAGNTWTNITGNLAVTNTQTIEFVGGATPAILVGTQQGVFRMVVSAPGVWSELGASSLPNAQVWELHYNAANDLLVAGTMGRGSWTFSAASLGEQINSPVAGSGGVVNIAAQGDMLIGSDGNDTIVGADGNDTLNGMAGNDSLAGGLGNDSLLGGAGSDTLDGGGGDDTLDGQNGNDVVSGGDGQDTFVWNGAGDGVDTLSSVSGYDSVRVNGNGSSNNYTVSQVNGQVKVSDGSASITVASVIQVIEINGGGGDDTINVQALDRVGTATLLTINGDAGNDTISAAGVKLGLVYLALNGGTGNDSLTGGNGNDTLDGGDGNDRLDGGLGDDLLLGGLGVDRIIGGDGNDTVFGGDDQDSISGGNGDDSLSGDAGADTIEGGNGNDTIDGGLGADTLRGDVGNDSLLGGFDADSLAGGAGNDTLLGGGSDDTLSGENGNDKLFGEDGNDSISGGDGDDTINGGDGDDTITGDVGNDLIGGANGSDFLNGGAGNDTLTGGDGNDTLLGGAGNDVLLGDEGDDSLNGQGGSDTLTPGEGNDIVADPTELNTSYVLSAALETALDTI